MIAELVLFSMAETLAAPKSYLWARWTAHDPKSAAVIDHAPWEAFLKKYIATGSNGVNDFPYGRDVG